MNNIGTVYIVQTVDEQYVKIGFTSRMVVIRLDQVHSSKFAREHGGIEMLGFFPASIEVETELHRMFDQFRVQGEWYERRPILERFGKVTVPVFVDRKVPLAMVEMASRGGKTRAASMTAERRSEIARIAGRAGGRGRTRKAA